MANDVVLGSSMRTNLLSLQSTQRTIDTTQLRLATGKKVNSALDNPQSFFQANSLNNRAADLTRLLDGIGQSVRTIEQADKGVTALTSLVEQASSVADQAQSELRAAAGLSSITGTKDLRGKNLTDTGTGIANTNSFSITIKDDDINSGTAVTQAITIATGDTVYDIAAKINDKVAIGNADFSDNVRASVDSSGRLKIEALEDGAALRVTSSTIGAQGIATLGLDGYVGTENTAATTRQGGTAIAGHTLTSTASAAAKVDGKYEASATLVSAGFITSGDEIGVSFEIDGETVTVANTTSTKLTETSTIQDLVDQINNSGNDKISASFDVDTGEVKIAFDDSVGTAKLNITSVAASVVDFGFGTGASDNAAASTANDVNSESFRLVGSSANLDQYTKDFNKLRDQIDGIVKDANYRGVNLLSGDKLTTFFNEDRSNSLETEGLDLTVSGLGIDKADFKDAASVQKALDQVSASLTSVRNFGSSIANDLSVIQTRRDFTQQTISTLKSGAADLTDADPNEEGANLLALQTRQQLGVTSLSLASQSQQSVLRLF